MDGVSFELILLGQDLLVSVIDVLSVLLEQVVHSNVEVFMPFDGLGVMVDIFGKLSMLDVHIFESVSIFLTKKLVKKDFLQIYSLDIEKSYHAIEISFKAEIVVSISAKVIHIYLLLDDNLWISHLGYQIQSNILESQEACKIEWGSPLLISLHKQLQYVILALN